METMDYTLYIIVGVAIFAFILMGVIVAKLYKRSSKEFAFVRTGMGGEKVILNGGAIVLPVFHETVDVSMGTIKLEVARGREQALITGDHMRADILAEFYLRVKPDATSISQAAQSLGKKTHDAGELRKLVEGKFVDGLRSVASAMTMKELHEQRSEFVQKVQVAVAADLEKNGLELETVSLTGLDQTNIEFLDPSNAFDAQGLLALTAITEGKKKARNDIEQDTKIEIQEKDLKTTEKSLILKKDQEYAELDQEREIATRKAEQEAEVGKQRAEQRLIAENADIESIETVNRKRIASEKLTKEEDIKKDQAIASADIAKDKAIKLAEQQKAIEINEKSQEESVARAKADEARADAIKAEESVVTAQATAIAERKKSVELVEASQEAERDALVITIGAEAEKKAAQDLSDAKNITAEAEAKAIIVVAGATKQKLLAEAEGADKINAAENTLNEAQINLKAKLALIEALPKIIEQSVKPMENIDSIKILETGGLGMGAAGSTTTAGGGSGDMSLPDQISNAALKYRSHAPLIDNFLKEFGLPGGIAGLGDFVGKENLVGAEVPAKDPDTDIVTEAPSIEVPADPDTATDVTVTEKNLS